MSPGFWQLMLILLIIVIVFGPGKLPVLFSEVGKSIKKLKKELSHSKEAEDSKD